MMTLQLSWDDSQRVGVLAALPSLLQRFGVRSADLLMEVGLSPDALDKPAGTISYRGMGRLLACAVEATRCPHLGLLLGSQVDTSSLGLVGELMRHAPTLDAALQDFAAYQHQNSRGSVVYLLRERQQVCFGYAVYQQQVPGSDIICDTAAMAGVSLVRELTGAADLPPTKVLLCRPEPNDLQPYYDMLGSYLRFDSEQTALLLPRLLLERPIRGADSYTRSDLRKRLGVLGPSNHLELVERLRRAIRIAPIRGDATADGISLELGLGRRTLDRRLQLYGVRFQEILDETRCTFAQQLLAQTRLSIGEIARLVGYDDPSVLTRAFVRWTGQTPSTWRSTLESSVTSDHVGVS